jgi:putative transposase
LHAEGVSTIYVGDLRGVLETHWSVSVNAKTDNFWAFRAFIDRVACTAEDYGIAIEARSEAWTSQTCLECGAIESTTRDGETLTCSCGFEGHADMTASETFLLKQEEAVTTVPRPMARPVCLTWDNHEWRSTTAAPRRRRNPNEEHTNRSTREGNLASVGATTSNPPA